MERLINRRQQGDLGEASAIEWLTRQGATVSAPLGHSPDYDLIAELAGQLLRVQAKTTVRSEFTKDGEQRWPVLVCTNGGNQSWSGVSKYFDSARCDALFVLVGDGRRWFIPSVEVEAKKAVTLGGLKYSEFEIEPAPALLPHVYGEAAVLDSDTAGGVSKRSKDGGCKPSGIAFAGSTPASPITPSQTSTPLSDSTELQSVKRGTAPHGQTRVSGNRQIVIPKRAFETAGLSRGDRLKAVATGSGEVLFRRVARESQKA